MSEFSKDLANLYLDFRTKHVRVAMVYSPQMVTIEECDLDYEQAKALHEWLGRALAASAQETKSGESANE